MKKFAIKLTVLGTTALLMYFLDVAPRSDHRLSGLQLVPEAHAIAGVRRRSARRGVAVGYAAGESTAHAEESAAAASAATATTAAATTAATTEAAPATKAPAPVYGALPEGTIEPALPDGCTTMSAENVQYYHCGENYFRAVFQGNELVYVTVNPPAS